MIFIYLCVSVYQEFFFQKSREYVPAIIASITAKFEQIIKIILTHDCPEQLRSLLVCSFQWDQTNMTWSRISKAYHFLKWLANCVDTHAISLLFRFLKLNVSKYFQNALVEFVQTLPYWGNYGRYILPYAISLKNSWYRETSSHLNLLFKPRGNTLKSTLWSNTSNNSWRDYKASDHAPRV